MAPPSDRFKPIQRLANQRERSAATALGESLKQRAQELDRLDTLRRHRTDYLERFARDTRNGLSRGQLLEYQVFIAKLETAIAHQEEIVARSQRDCDASKAHWRTRYSKSKAMENAIDRMKTAERKDQDKREQADSDERAQRKR